MVRKLLPLFFVGFFCVVSSAEDESPTGLITELAKASGVLANAFDCNSAVLTGTKNSGYILSFSRHPGEGTETCKARYSREGALQDIDCSFESTNESMGDENSRTVVKAQRFYDIAGVLSKIAGSYKETRLRDRKVMRERKLKSISDETLERLTKPLLKIPDEILVQVKR